MNVGGYDDGYVAVPCLWGKDPGSLVTKFIERYPVVDGWRVLDLGCGEGKNSAPFARLGCEVVAVDCSAPALKNGKKAFTELPIGWLLANVEDFTIEDNAYDVIIAYGMLHCLNGLNSISKAISRIQRGTKDNGFNIICAFNDRSHDFSAHPNFYPSLLPHMWYEQQYVGWRLIDATDEDLFEKHPHNNIAHHHSLTRIMAQKV